MRTSKGPEAWFRLLLHAYPRGWRQDRGEELVAVLLAAAEDSGRRRPSPADAVDLIGHGLAARGRELMRPFPAVLRNRVAALSLAGGAAMAAVCLVCGELPPVRGPERPAPYPSATTFGPFLTLGAVLYLAWIAVLALTVAGALRPSRISGAVLVVLGGGVTASSLVARSHPIAAPPVYLPAFLGALSLLVCFGRIDLSRAGRWLLASGSTALAAALVAVATFRTRPGWLDGVGDPRWIFYRSWQHGLQLISQVTPVLCLTALVVAALVTRVRPGWFTSTLVATLPWLLFALLFFDGGMTANGRLPALAVAVVGVMAALGRLTYRAGVHAGRRADQASVARRNGPAT